MPVDRLIAPCVKLETKEHSLDRRLGLPEALSLSLSIVGSSMAMAFNVSLAVRFAGRAAPLAFGIATIALGMVALAFVRFSRRVAHAGSAYAYIGQSFGWHWGFMAGWSLLLTYATYAAAAIALIGNFLQAAVQNQGFRASGLWFASGIAGLLLASICAYRDVKLAGRLMVVLEAFSVAAIIFLLLAILTKLSATGRLSVSPFLSTRGIHWSGVGPALVFCVLSFAGFEAAATLAEERKNPHRNIPIAILGTCALAGVFYVFVTYAQIVGFGIDSTRDLASSTAPLNDLANRYVSRNFATAIDLAAAVSALSCVLGSLSAAARLLFALGRSGLASRIAAVHPTHGTPSTAVIVVGLLCLGGFTLWAPFADPGSHSGDLLTIGTLALVLVYMAVNVADLAESFEARRVSWSICGMAGFSVLLWSIYNSVYPTPAFPGNLWPYCVVIWVLAGVAIAINHPVLREKLGNSQRSTMSVLHTRNLFIGVLATITMDVVSVTVLKLGLAFLPPRLIGRWFGLIAQGHFLHSDIAEAPPISHETAIAMPMHYAIGITLGIVYLLVTSILGLSPRSLITALGFGLCTNLLPWLLMFPAMGYGWFGTQGPPGTRLFISSLVTHCFYGIGLWLGMSVLG